MDLLDTRQHVAFVDALPPRSTRSPRPAAASSCCCTVPRARRSCAQRALDDEPPISPKIDLRNYGIGAQILRDLNVGRMRLLAKPRKMPSMTGFDLEVTGYVEQPPRAGVVAAPRRAPPIRTAPQTMPITPHSASTNGEAAASASCCRASIRASATCMLAGALRALKEAGVAERRHHGRHRPGRAGDAARAAAARAVRTTTTRWSRWAR